MERVSKNSIIPLAENLIPKTNDICETVKNCLVVLIALLSKLCFSEKPPGRGKRQRSAISAINNKRIPVGVIEKKTETRQKTPAEKRVICTKLYEGKVKAGI